MTSKDLLSQSFKLRQSALPKAHWNQQASTLHSLILTVPNSSSMYECGDFPNLGLTRKRSHATKKAWHEVIRWSMSHPEELTIVDSRGRIPLQAACACKAPINVVRILLTYGKKEVDESWCLSSLIRTDNHGRTALVLAIANHASLEVVQFLLNRCPRASEIRDNAENLPLHVACMGDFDNDRNLIVQSLVKAYRKGAGKFSRSEKTPLHLAIECGGSLAVIRTLVEAHPASLNVRSCGEIPLTAAIKNNAEPSVIECLVRGKPSVVEQVDGIGMTPLHHAIAYRSSVSIIDELSENSACIIVPNKIGDTPVHMAIKDRIRPYDIVDVLVQKSNSVVHCRNKAGDDPLDLVFKRLLKHLRQSRNYLNETSLWKTLVLLLKSRFYGTGRGAGGEESNDVFHMLVQTNVPFQIAEKALACFPSSLQEIDTSTHCLPIFHIVGSDASARDRIAEMMLEQYPNSAKVKNANNDLLLAKAAQHSLLSADLFRNIITANPQALAVAGTKDGLFPFMRAATPKPDLSTRSDHAFYKQFVDWGFVRKQGQQQQLDVIYTLLREGPYLIPP